VCVRRTGRIYGRGGPVGGARKSGHHRRRTVGMVGNDPVMTLTPRIGG